MATAPTVSRLLTNDQSFKARLAYDAKNLYVQYEVVSPLELTTAMTDPQTIFKAATCWTFSWPPTSRPIPSARPGPRRRAHSGHSSRRQTLRRHLPAEGEGFQRNAHVLTSPTGKESFDAIEVTDAVQLAYAKGTGGFSAQLTIPLSVLGWTPQSGTKVRLDLGYIFGNATGSKATGRLYWTNTGFEAGVLNDIPTESRLVPSEWGEAEVE
jgi:hypothetical protein